MRHIGVSLSYTTALTPIWLERGALSLVRITVELFGRKSSGSELENQD
jgi:hypothetical protein